jgi:hypothetical protein
MNMQRAETKNLLTVVNTTSAGVTGAWVDLQGFVTNRQLKVVFVAGIGTTAGTCGGSVQTADDTAGTTTTTRLTLSGLTATGGIEEGHFLTGNQRYVRVLGTVQSGKDMNLGALILGEALYRP